MPRGPRPAQSGLMPSIDAPAPAPAAVAPAYFLIPTSSAIDTDLPIFSRTKQRW